VLSSPSSLAFQSPSCFDLFRACAIRSAESALPLEKELSALGALAILQELAQTLKRIFRPLRLVVLLLAISVSIAIPIAIPAAV
jgi:hypothetical protein